MRFLRTFLMLIPVLLLCSCSSNDPECGDNAATAAAERNAEDIFNILAPYPSLEHFFTSGNLSRAEFEDKLYRELLGDDAMAQILVDMIDGIPPLFAPRADSEAVYPEEINPEMRARGPMPDLICALADVTRGILELPEEQRRPVYAYLDRLDDLDALEALETADYLRMLLWLAVEYFCTLDADDVNTDMGFTARDLAERRNPCPGRLDFSDIDTKVADIAAEAPQSLADLIVAARDLLVSDTVLGDPVLEQLAALLYTHGDSARTPGLAAAKRTALEALYVAYDESTLGDIFCRAWSRGPEVGPRIAELGAPGYGAGTLQDHALLQMLAHPRILDQVLVSIHEFDSLGYFDLWGDDAYGPKIVEQINRMIADDPHLQPRTAPGPFPDGHFHPREDIDFAELSGLQALLKFGGRFHTALPLTSPLLWEGEDGARKVRLMRTILPVADHVPVAACLWSPMYEKSPEHDLGHGQPITEARGYGLCLPYTGDNPIKVWDEATGKAVPAEVPSVWVSPGCAGCVTGAETAFLSIVESIVHGPYDNIWDNANFMLYERDIFLVLDLVEMVRLSPVMKILFDPVLALMDMDSLPLVLMRGQGINGLIYTELNEVMDGVHENVAMGLSAAGVPSYIRNMLLDLMSKPAVKEVLQALLFDMFGKPETDETGKTCMYMYPEDLRDLWPTILAAIGYYAPETFLADRFQSSRTTPSEYRRNYDTSVLSDTDKRAARNPLLPLIAAVCHASYTLFEETVEGIPSSLSHTNERTAALQAEFGAVMPVSYVLNLALPLLEMPIETHSYDEGGLTMPLIEIFEPWLAAQEPGPALDRVLDLCATLGSPQMKGTRTRLASALAGIAGTCGPDSTAPAGLAHDLLEIPRKAQADPREWKSMERGYHTTAALFRESSPHQVVSTLMELLSHLTDVDLSRRELHDAATGFATLSGTMAEHHVLGRMFTDLAEVLLHLDSTHTWADALTLQQRALAPDGVLSYILLGLERDPADPWDDILRDTDAFLRSDTMMDSGEDSFWHALHCFIKFMADSVE